MSIEDLTIKQMTQAMELISNLIEIQMQHTMVIVGEPDHDCDLEDSIDEDFEHMPDFDDFDVRVFLSFEQSTLALCGMMRHGLRQQGFEELTKEVGP